jgi:transposase
MIPPDYQEVSMTDHDLWREANSLHKDGLSNSAIARKLSLDRRTVARLLTLDQAPTYRRDQKHKPVATLDPFKPFVRQRVDDGLTNTVKLLREVQDRGYTGGITMLREFVAPLRPSRQPDATVRFETLPGEQAQVDWGYMLGTDPDHNVHRFLCFAMVLGYSRAFYAEFFARMDLASLLRGLIHAFDYFGGVTRTILFDNMKQVILERDEVHQRYHYNARFRDFSDYYSFRPRLCQPYRPQTKGKIESGVGYVKGNFWCGEVFYGLTLANQGLRIWLDTVANVRNHGTTHIPPIERLPLERLQPLPMMPYEVARMESRLVSKDCFICFDGNRYSVPAEYVGRIMTVKDRADGRVRIYYQDQLIAQHVLSASKGQMITDPAHTAALWAKVRRRPPNRDGRSGMVRLGTILNEVTAPLLAQRPLAVYEQLALGDAGVEGTNEEVSS